jgi:hypothetical protein
MDSSYVKKIEAENEELQRSLQEANAKLDKLKSLYDIPEFILSYDKGFTIEESEEAYERFKKDLLDYTYKLMMNHECWKADDDEGDIRHLSLPLSVMFYSYETKMTITFEVPVIEDIGYKKQELYTFSINLTGGEICEKFKREALKIWAYCRMNHPFMKNANKYLQLVKEAKDGDDLKKIKISHKK